MNPVPNPKDKIYLIWIILVTAIVIGIQVITPPGARSLGTVYAPMLIFADALIFISIFSNAKLTGAVIFGKTYTFKKLAGILGFSWSVGLLLSLIIYTFSSTFTAAFSIAGLALGAGSSLGILFSGTVITPEVEETLFASAIFPTITSSLRDTALAGVIMFLLAAVFIFFIPIAPIILGSVSISSIGLLFVAGGLVFIMSRFANKTVYNHAAIRILIGLLFTAVAVSFYHLFVYGPSPDMTLLLLMAGAFSIAGNVINVALESTLSSRLLHAFNNGTVLAILLDLNYIWVLIAIGIYTLIMIAAFTVRADRRGLTINTNAGLALA